jgi:hypothetical protein
MPALVLLAAAGLHLVLRWARTRRREGRTTAVRRVTAVLCVLAVLSVGINLGLAVLYQRKLNPGVPESELASFLRFQYELHRDVPGGAPPDVVHGGDRLPRDIPETGTLYVVGDCDALYFSVGYGWRALERTPATGSHLLRVRFAEPATPAWQPLVTSGTPGAATWVAARVLPDGRVRFGYRAQGTDDVWHESPPQDVGRDRTATVGVVLDTRTGGVEVTLDGRPVLGLTTLVRPADDATVGRNDLGGPVAATFAGTVEEPAVPPTLCRDLLRG